MIGQERELAEKRERDQRSLLALEFGHKLLAKLEQIKLQQLEAFRTSEERVGFESPEVKLVGLVNQNRVQLPWEFDPRTDQSFALLSGSSFAHSIETGERAEFGNNNPKRAVKIYRRALASASHPVQQGYARLLLARVLAKLGLEEESRSLYQEVLKLSFEVVDEAGIPLALYAVGPLVEEGQENQGILERIESETAAVDWMSPPALYLLQELAEGMAGGTDQLVAEQLARVEQSIALREALPGLGLQSARSSDRPVWVPYGEEVWLVTLVPLGEESKYLLVAVSASEVLESVEPSRVTNEPFSLVTDASLPGEDLGSNFPGLKVSIPADLSERMSTGSDLQVFYLITMLLVLSVTFFGAYLLWRDVRREVKAAELRSQFVSSVSHELKTPLTAIQMFAETLRLGRTRNSQTRQEYLETIVNESQRLTRLLNNVLDFSRIEAGKRAYRPEPTNLGNVVQAAVKAMEYPLKQEGFELKVETENNLPEVQVDRDGLEQAVLNLLSNAMKYSGDSRQIRLTLKKDDSFAVIQVADRGVGIKPEEQKQIFEKFYRVASAESERIPGTGLGLSLVSHVVSAHKGHLDLESRPGEGSTFSIYLPMEQGE
jgi:hypothetical protein